MNRLLLIQKPAPFGAEARTPHAVPAAVADLGGIAARPEFAMTTCTDRPEAALPAAPVRPEDHDRRVERLCDLAADRAGLIRGVAPALKACAGYDRVLDCCAVYYRLGKGEEDRLDEHRGHRRR